MNLLLFGKVFVIILSVLIHIATAGVGIDVQRAKLNSIRIHDQERVELIQATLQHNFNAVDGEQIDFLKMHKTHNLLREAIGLQKSLANFYNFGEDYKRILTTKLHTFQEVINGFTQDEMVKMNVVELVGKAKILMGLAAEVKFIIEQYLARRENTNRDQLWSVQGEFDRNLQKMVGMVDDGLNPFVQLDKAEELLNKADLLEEAIAKYGKQRNLETKEATIRAYNEFAWRLEALAIGGLVRDSQGQFSLASIDKMVGQVKRKKGGQQDENQRRVVDENFLGLIGRLLQSFHQFRLPPMGEIKIRGESHLLSVSVGLFEYGFTSADGTKRGRVNEYLDDYISAILPYKPSKIGGVGLINLMDAELVYNKMAKQGWTGHSADSKRDCRTFVWEFVCQLLHGRCPREVDMPRNFHISNEIFAGISGTVFKTQVVARKEEGFNCESSTREISLQVDVREMAREKQDAMLPPTVEHGKCRYTENGRQEFDIKYYTHIPMEEALLTGVSNEQVRLFKVALNVYICKIQENYHAFIPILKFWAKDAILPFGHSFYKIYKVDVLDKNVFNYDEKPSNAGHR